MLEKIKNVDKNYIAYKFMYVPMFLESSEEKNDDIDKLKFNCRSRTYTFNKNILNHIYANWKVRNGSKRTRKIGKMIDNKFVFEIANGDRLTQKEIAEIIEFLNKNLNETKEDDLPYIKLINSQNLTKEEWLKQRQRGIGGSDLGGILGLHQYSSPYKVWLQKTGREKSDFNPNFFTKVGNELEDFVAREFCDRENKKVSIEPNILQNKENSFLLANIDRWIVGENAGLECKTINIFKNKELKKGIVPQQYILQCMHYMAVTGATHWYLAFLVVGTADEFHTFKIDRDEKLIELIIKKSKEFWHFVENDIEPEISIDGDKETTKRLLDLNFNDSEQIFISDESSLKLLDSLDQQIKDLEKQKERIKQDILFKMGGNSKAVTENYEIKVVETTRNNFDKKKLFELIEIDEEIKEKCIKTSTSKTLKIKKMEV